ncbi:MAG: hypothetical protein ABH821_02460 [archaeon]
MTKKPLGVKVIAFLFVLGGVYELLSGLTLALFGGITEMTVGSEIPNIGMGASTGLGTILSLTVGVIGIIVGILVLWLGVSVWKQKKRARITGTVIAGLIILSGLFYFLTLEGIITMVIGAVILYFFWVNKETKKVFE